MKLIARVLVPMSLAVLNSAAAAAPWFECPRWLCDPCWPLRSCNNSPVVAGAHVGGLDLHEVQVGAAAGTAGFAVAAVDAPLPATRNDRGPVLQPAAWLAGWGVNLNSPRLSAGAIAGAPLHAVDLNARVPVLPLPVGTTIELHDGAGARYDVLVSGHGRTRFWAGADGPVTTHVLLWSGTADKPARRQPVCAAGANQAILFGGDRYDAERKAVTATGAAAAGWLNIACAGTALAKLYLMRHTEASQQVPTTRAERQAMLKMLAADVYGDGRSFTVAGQPLRWADAKQITRFGAGAGAVEAVWGEHGAVCLNLPRIAALEGAIAAHGRRPPRCTDFERLPPGHVVSAHPL